MALFPATRKINVPICAPPSVSSSAANGSGSSEPFISRIVEHFVQIHPVQAGIAERVEVVRLDHDLVALRQPRKVDAVLVFVEHVRLVHLHGVVHVVDADQRMAALLRALLRFEHDVAGPRHHRLRELLLERRPILGIGRPHVPGHVDLHVAREDGVGEVVVFFERGQLLGDDRFDGGELLAGLCRTPRCGSTAGLLDPTMPAHAAFISAPLI